MADIKNEISKTEKIKEKKVRECGLFGRLGNKTNDIKFFKNYLPLDCDKVIEPFGGSFAVSRIVYNDDKYKKYVNDIDPSLIAIYNEPKKYFDLSNKLNDIAKKYIIEGSKTVDSKKFFKDVNDDVSIDKDSIFYNYWKKEKVVRGSLIKCVKNYACSDFIKSMESINFTSDDYLKVVNKFRKDEKAFIFIDPPYLFSDNSQYSSTCEKGKNDMTMIMVDLLKIIKSDDTKAKIMIIVNDLDLLRYIFNDYIKGDYKRIYQLSKKEDTHLIICNYDI